MRRSIAVLAALLLLAAPATGQTLKRVREEFAKIGERAIPATVIVRSTGVMKKFSRGIPGSSGVIVHPDGYVLSDADATLRGFQPGTEGAGTQEKIHGTEAIVRLPAPDLRTFTAVLVRRDLETDSSLLRITGEIKGKKLPYLPLGVSSNLHVGAFGLVVGNAFGMGQESEPALTLGIVSALLDRKEETGGAYERIYVSAAVNPGNNGGPYVNSLGRVVGIVSSWETDPKSPYRPLGFVTPIDRIRPAYEDLEVYEKIFPPMTKRPMRSDDAAVLEEAFEIVTKHVKPSLVSFTIKRAEDAKTEDPVIDRRTGKPRLKPDGKPIMIPRFPGPYSGVVIRSDGWILTSTANLWEYAKIEDLTVFLADGKALPGRVVARDRFRGVALIKVEATDLRPLPPARKSDYVVGRFALAFGNPFGAAQGHPPLLTFGVVSGLNRLGRERSAIQTDAGMTDGIVGGALVTIEGRLLGINLLVDPKSYGRNSGVGFAISLDTLAPGLPDLMRGKDVEPGFMGIGSPGLTREGQIVFTGVASDGPAGKGGLKAGDRLLLVDGTDASEYASPAEFIEYVRSKRPGDTLKLTVKRGTIEKEISIVLGSRPGD